MHLWRPLWTFLLFHNVLAQNDGTSENGASEFDTLLSDATSHLARNAYSDAIRALTEAIAIDDTHYLAYLKRATSYVSIGRTSLALDDFEKVLKLKPDLEQAHLQRSRLFLKEGRFTEASDELNNYKKSKAADETAINELYEQIFSAGRYAQAATEAFKTHHMDKAVEHASEALVSCPNSLPLRQLRLDAYLRAGDYESAVTDLTRLSQLQPKQAELHLKLAHVQYLILGAFDPAVATLKQCLAYDPDNTRCHKAFKSFKQLNKDVVKARNFIESQNWNVAVGILVNKKTGLTVRLDEIASAATEYIPAKAKAGLKAGILSMACKAFLELNDKRALSTCSQAFDLDPEDPDAVIGKAEQLIKDEAFADAVRLLEKCWEGRGRGRRDIQEKHARAQRLLKVSQTKDYYKVLGVSRDATTRTIRKKFRSAAKSAHPDKPGGSEAKMAALNEAFEVLNDPEKRSLFDSGVDPNSQEAQEAARAKEQGHPFHGGFQGFQGFPQGFPFGQGSGGFQGFQGFQGFHG